MESARFIEVDTSEGLEEVFARSNESPALLFKHSVTCPISLAAYRSVATVDNDVYLVVVQRARDISDEVESRTGIRHESPQALVISNGACVFHASHYNIEPGSIAEHL
ncbi:MAG: bacillithiol system redox-active protein YtxJ [Acidobacteriota bacterium]|nr:bacillithiol system redox-active protein YtxJ [Acidobacteriota bacterium]MDH3531072.1 bacillithiol system redox-active protein YtxJ [Acidobacteriota bacterium]